MKGLGVLLICFTLVSCSSTGYKVHPGSINTFDSVTADTLAGVKATIDAARPQFAAGTLPANLKPLMNTLISAYDKAEVTYKAWHSLASASASTSQLQADITAVTQALAAYFTAGGK